MSQKSLSQSEINTSTFRGYKTTCVWKFVQRNFIASKLNAGCGGYFLKICKILVDIVNLKAGFPFGNLFMGSDFFHSKAIKSGIGPYFFTSKMRIQQKVASYEEICKRKTSLICPANRSKVVYLSTDPNVGPFKGQFPLVCWILHMWRSYSNNMIG